MVGRLILGLALLLSTQADAREFARFSPIFQLLQRTVEGRALLHRAVRRWGLKGPRDLTALLRWGSVSRTDAVLTRQFDPETGSEERRREVFVYLKAKQPRIETVLDLAHELTHALEAPTWDPYDPDLTVGKYILAAIEGRGGEVEALFAECRVALSLSRQLGSPALRRCRRYLQDGRVSREKIRQDYYRVGKWKRHLLVRLGREARLFPELSGAEATLLSSTGGTPYPVALQKEFEALNQAACNNTRRRLTAIRSPASGVTKEVQVFISKRCST